MTRFFRSTRREFIWLSIGNQASALSGLLLMLVLARSVSVPEVGRVVFAQALAGVVLTVLDIRFEDAIQRFYPALSRSAGSASANNFFWRICRFDVALGLGIIGLGVGCWALDLFPTGAIWVPTYELLGLVTAGVGTAIGSLNGGYAVVGRLATLGRVTVATTALNAAFVVVGTLVAGGKGFLVGQLGGSCCQVIVCWWVLRPHLPRTRHAGRGQLPGGFKRFLVKSSAASSLALGGDTGVLALAGVIGSPVLVAYLKVAQAPGRVVASAFSPLAVQAFPRIATLAAKDDVDAVKALTARVTRAALVAALVVVLVSVPLMSPAVNLMYGPEFEPVWGAAALLVVAACVRASVAWSKVLPLAIGRPGLRLVVLCVESVLLLATVGFAATQSDEAEGALIFGLGAGLVALMVAGFWLTYVRRMRLVPVT